MASLNPLLANRQGPLGLTETTPLGNAPLTVPPPNPTAPINFTPANPGKAPTPTPYGDFVAPDPLNFTHSPDYQYQLDAQAKARQRSAAARGTLLGAGTVAALQRDAAGIAAGDYQNVFNRALQGYTTNRDTNQQNFGQQLGSFGANTDATLGYGRLGLDAAKTNYDTKYRAAEDQRGYLQDQAVANTVNATNQQDAINSQFAAQVAAAKAQNDAESARIAGPTAPLSPKRRTFR